MLSINMSSSYSFADKPGLEQHLEVLLKHSECFNPALLEMTTWSLCKEEYWIGGVFSFWSALVDFFTPIVATTIHLQLHELNESEEILF